jgi:hypothetical protein
VCQASTSTSIEAGASVLFVTVTFVLSAETAKSHRLACTTSGMRLRSGAMFMPCHFRLCGCTTVAPAGTFTKRTMFLIQVAI